MRVELFGGYPMTLFFVSELQCLRSCVTIRWYWFKMLKDAFNQGRNQVYFFIADPNF